jgi:hypothetical protein
MALMALVLPACVDQAGIVRSQAVKDFICTADSVQAESVEEGSGLFRARGCGREDIYEAPWNFSDPAVSPLPRATFDLSCPAGQTTVRYLGNRTVGVAGCGKRASYTWDGDNRVWIGGTAVR